MSQQRRLWDVPEPRFDGRTYDAKQDSKRLTCQLEAVKAVLVDGRPYSLAELAAAVSERIGKPASEASISARVRDLRKPRFGEHIIVRERITGGLWRYRMVR